MQIGTVTAVTPALTVTIDGSTSAAPAQLASSVIGPAQGDRVLVELAAGRLFITAKISAAPEPWKTPTFQNGWVEYTGYTVRYRKENGRVFVKGLVRNGTPNGFAMLTLPVGYRPLSPRYFACSAYNAGAFTFATVIMIADGSLMHYSGGNTQVSLDEVNFEAEQ